MRATALRDLPVARQVLLLQVLVVLVLVAASVSLATYDARRDARTAAAERSVAVARTVADSPDVLAALAEPDPSATLQPYAERVRRDSGVDFVVVMDLDRTRYTHPDPAKIGRPFVGDLGEAPQGGVLTQQFTGSLGPSVRSVVPVTDGSEVVALVAVGITVDAIDDQVREDLVLVLLAAGAVLLVGLLGTWLVGRRLRRQTHGLGEREITRMYEYYSAVLQAVREGLVLVDGDGVVRLVNDEARRLLDLPEDAVGRPLDDLGLAPGLVAAARGGEAAPDDLYVAGDRLLLVSTAPASWQGREVGAVVTLRDRTELQSVTGELEVVRGLTESLRSQTHEAANRLHTVVSLVEMGRVEEAVELATEELQVAQLLTDRVVAASGEPVVAALLLGKSAEAAERGIELTVSGAVPEDVAVPARDLVTVLGNLVDNALDAVGTSGPRRVAVVLGVHDGRLRVAVGDNGPGLSPEDAARVLERGWTTKAADRADDRADDRGVDRGVGRGVGLALVAQVARRHGGTVAVGRSELGGAEFVVDLDLGSGRP